MTHYYPQEHKIKIGNYVGLAQKAGKIAAGDAAALNAIKSTKALLLLLAEDIAPATGAELLNLAEIASLPVVWWPDKISLGLLVGKSKRGAIAILDKGFTQAIIRTMNNER